MGQTQGKTVAPKYLSSREHKKRLNSHKWRHEVGPDAAPKGRLEAPFQLRSVTLATFLESQRRDIIVIPDSATVGEAMNILRSNSIHSAPVSINAGHYLGIVNIRDLAEFVVQHGTGVVASGSSIGAMDHPIRTVLGYINAEKVITVHRLDTLHDVVKKMNKHRVHRLMVVNKEEQLVGVISQFGLLRVLYENIDALYNQPDAPLTAFGLLKNVVVVSENDKLLDAVAKMTTQRISVVGVTNEQGHLVGEFSMGEMRALEHEQANRLSEFFVKDVATSQAVLTVQPCATLRDVVEILFKEKHRRVFITEEDNPPDHYGKIVGVVTLTDLLRLLFDSPLPHY
eukprot:CFRG7314T1